jgi:hypothetical protein
LRVPTSSLALSLALFATGLSGALPGMASAQTLTLEWKAPPACPDGESVRARAQAMLAKSAAKAQEVRAQGVVLAKSGTHLLTLRMQIDERTVSKKLEAHDCEVLGDTAAWLIAVAIDPNVAPPPPRASAGSAQGSDAANGAQKTSESPEASETEGKPTPAPGTKPEEPSKPPEPPRPARKPLPLGYAAELWGGVWVPGLAGPMASLGGRLSLDVQQLRVGLRYLHRFARQEDLAQGASSEYRADELAALACFIFTWGQRIQAGPYAALTGQRLSARARGITEAQDATRLWLGLEVGAEARIRIWRFVDGLAQLGAGVPLTARPVFQVTGLEGESGVNFFSVSASLGVGISLP